jgi:hypothetical protein
VEAVRRARRPARPARARQLRRRAARRRRAAGAHSPEWTPGGIERAGRDSFELVTLGPDDPAQRAQAAALTRQHGALVSHRHVVAGKQGFLLLRPDGFVAASGRSADLGWLADALATLAGSNKELRK